MLYVEITWVAVYGVTRSERIKVDTGFISAVEMAISYLQDDCKDFYLGGIKNIKIWKC